MPNLPPAPSRKVTTGGLAGALSVIIVWAVEEFGGVTIPAEIASAFTVIATAVVAYLVPERT